MIIYTKADSALIIPCGLNTVVCPDTSHDLQMKTVDSSTVSQDVTPDAGYFGLYRVIVNPYELDSKTVDSSTEPQVITSSKDGLFQVIVNPYTLESKTQTITVNGEYSFTPDEANGLSRVDISVNVADTPTVLQAKTADASTETQVITPDEGYDGLSQVTVDPYTLEDKSDSITDNGLYTYYPSTADGMAQVTIDVSVDTVNNQTKTVDSSTTIQYVQPDQGYTGLEYVAVNPYVLDSKTVNPSTDSQTVTSDEDGLSSVTVNPVTAAIDPDLVPGNIKKDVDILGVVGTFEGGTLQSKTVDSSTVSQTVTPDGVNYGLSQVTVNPYTEETISETITQNGQYTYTAQNADTLSEVTIDVSVADIPAVIQTKSVTYTQNGEYTVTKDAGYDGMSSVDISVNVAVPQPVMQTKTVNSSTSSQTITPDQNYDGLSSVTVNPYALENKTVDSSTSQQTISADNGYDGLNMVTVNPYTLDSKTVDSSTVSQTVTSSQDGLSSVTVNPYVLDSKTVDASIASVTVTSDEDGLSSVTVNAVTAAIDSNIKDYNIVEGVTILGVTGSRHIANLQLMKYVDSSTTAYTAEPDQGYDGMRSVSIRPYHLNTDSSILTQNGQYVFEPSAGYVGLSQVTVDVSVDGQQINNQNKTVDSSTVSQSVTSDSGYTGLGTVTVNPYTTETDSSILTQNGQYVFTPTNADALSQVTVDVSVGASVNLQTKTVDPSTSIQYVTPDQGYDGLSQVTVTPNSGRRNLEVFTYANGYFPTNWTVSGFASARVSKPKVTSKTVDSSTVSQTFNPNDESCEYYSGITVNPYTTETDSSTITQNGTYTFTPTNADAISQVTINVSVASQGGGGDWVVNARKNVSTDASNVTLTANRNTCYDYLCQYATGLTAFPVIADVSVPYMRAYAKAFTGCGTSGSVTLPNLVSATGNSAFLETFSDNHVTTVSFPALTTVDGWHVMDGMFIGNSTLTDASFQVLTDVSGNYVMYFMFGDCTSLMNVSFPTLETVSGDYAMEDMFSGCTALTSMSFPELTTATGADVFKQIFIDTSMSTLSVPKLNPPTGNTHDGWDDICGPTATSIKTLTCKAGFATWERSNLQGLQNLTLTDLITDGLDLQYSPGLTAQSVLNILNAIDANATDKTISFYYGGLTVLDDAQGSVQTAYDTAVAAGWTINNLNIYHPLNHVTTGDSSTTMLEIPGVATTDTMLQASYRDYIDALEIHYIDCKNSSDSSSSNIKLIREYDLAGLLTGTANHSSEYLSVIVGDYYFDINATFGFIKYGNNRRSYIMVNGTSNTSGTDSTFVPDSTDSLLIKNCNWYSIKHWEGWDETSTGGSSKVLVHDYVPVSKTVSGTTQYGLLDQVTGVFYTNTGVTGS